MTQSRQILDPIVAGDSDTIQFDFTSKLAVGETISTQSVTSAVYSGTDANAASMVSGAAAASGNVVSQLIATSPAVAGGLVGVIYYLVCKITTSLGQTLQLAAYLSVIPAVP